MLVSVFTRHELQDLNFAFTMYRTYEIDELTLFGELINHRQTFQCLIVCTSIKYKIIAPHFIRWTGNPALLTRGQIALSKLLCWRLKPVLCPNPSSSMSPKQYAIALQKDPDTSCSDLLVLSRIVPHGQKKWCVLA